MTLTPLTELIHETLRQAYASEMYFLSWEYLTPESKEFLLNKTEKLLHSWGPSEDAGGEGPLVDLIISLYRFDMEVTYIQTLKGTTLVYVR